MSGVVALLPVLTALLQERGPEAIPAKEAWSMGAGGWIVVGATVASSLTAIILKMVDRRTESTKSVVEDGTALRRELWEQAESYRRELGEASEGLYQAKTLVVALRTEVGLLTTQCRYLIMLLKQHGVAPDLPTFNADSTSWTAGPAADLARDPRDRGGEK